MSGLGQRLYVQIALVFMASVTITLLFGTILPVAYRQNESTDYFVYYEPVARNILTGNGIVLSDHQPALSNPPGYAFILAGIFGLARLLSLPEALVNSGFALIFMAISATFIFLFARKVWGMPGAWVSVLFFMTYPFVLWLTKQPASEVPFMAAFYASVYLFWVGLENNKSAWVILALSGCLAGIAMLIRGIAIGVGVVLVVLLFVLKKNISVKRRFFEAFILLLTNVLVVIPWIFLAYQETGQIILLGTNGIPSIRDGLTFAVVSKGYRQKIEVPPDVANLQNELLAENASMDSFGTIARIVFGFLIKEPVPVVKLFLVKMLRSWYGTDSGANEFAISMIQIFYGVLALIAILAVWFNRRNTPGLLLFVGVFVLYFWGMTTLVLSILRYMVPITGMIALLMPGVFKLITCQIFLPKSDLL